MDEIAKILIVEDDATIRTILEMALLGAGFKDVKSSARGDEGLDEVKRGGRGPGTNDTVKRYSRGGCVMVDPSVRRLRVRLTW